MPHLERLRDELRLSYRGRDGTLIPAFYEPCLAESVRYQRATGYFTSAGLSQAARGVQKLLANGGRMQLVCSPHLSPEDIEALRKGYADRQDVLAASAQRQWTDAMPPFWKSRLEILAALIAEGRLDVKLAIPVDQDGRIVGGLYHEKFGLFHDFPAGGTGQSVAFTGSSNETKGGLVDNFESIDVYTSWREGYRIEQKQAYFDALWVDETDLLTVLDFTDASAELLRPYRPGGTPSEAVEDEAPTDDRWRHQDEAIAAFLTHERGVLNMATGTGKTRTALRIIERLDQLGAIDTVVVSTVGTDLLDQWYAELVQWATRLRLGTEGTPPTLRHYGSHRQTDRFERRPTGRIMLCSRGRLPAVLEALDAHQQRRTLVVHDEVHGLGSPANQRDLAGRSDGIRYRLGLSATPEREYDAEGTAFIEENVGPEIFEFGLGDAIERGILSPFEYHPLAYVPSEEDGKAIRAVHSLRARRRREGQPMSDAEFWTKLAHVHKVSEAKLPLFEAFLQQRSDLLDRCIIFVATKEYGEKVLPLVHKYRHRFHTYFGGEDPEILRRFAHGEIHCLLTCHRLSQGIDVRSLQTVVLFASDRAQLETIQRIGRCLRSDPDNLGKVAHVIDFVRTSTSAVATSDDDRRRFLAGLSRTTPSPTHG